MSGPQQVWTHRERPVKLKYRPVNNLLFSAITYIMHVTSGYITIIRYYHNIIYFNSSIAGDHDVPIICVYHMLPYVINGRSYITPSAQCARDVYKQRCRFPICMYCPCVYISTSEIRRISKRRLILFSTVVVCLCTHDESYAIFYTARRNRSFYRWIRVDIGTTLVLHYTRVFFPD